MNSQLSKSERKRRAKGIEQLVYELASLPDRVIVALPCDQEIKEEIRSAKNMKAGAKKRQLKYVTKLLRNKPVEELYDFLALKKGSLLKKNREFHELEYFRNLLITETVELYDGVMNNDGYLSEMEPLDLLRESVALDAIVDHLPDIDKALLKNTAIQYARTRNKKFSRELFRILKAAHEKIQYSQKQGKDNGI
jgi:ribosome-associated protein